MSNEFREKLYDGWDQCFSIDTPLFEEKTPFQHMAIFENRIMGRMLVLDGIVQTSQADEFIYHEMMAHVPMFAHGKARRVLIVGGGDGGMLREVLRHETVESAVLVEIDASVIELCRRYLPDHSRGAFDDPRTRIVIDDGMRFLEKTDGDFDVILVDSTDPVGAAEVLFSRSFYRACKKCLSPGGILVTQNGVCFTQLDEVRSSARHFKELFKDWHFFSAAVPSYTGGIMTFGWASDDSSIRQVKSKTLKERFNHFKFTTRYYTPELHAASFVLPRYVMDAIGK